MAKSLSLEVWGGIECTLNRVGSLWHSQLERSGHLHRLEDLQLIASLGIRTLRYPLLWEQFEPVAGQPICWDWADQRLNELQRLEIDPIVGLLHHGSGPGFTSLISDNFASGLEEYARQVATRFPWVTRYTPVNEPLTTARFSGLYGHWYPHGRSDKIFARALVNQCRATVLSMRAIRSVNSSAQLVQTDDLGTTYGTVGMQYQAEFDNERRWLGWDLICGRVTPTHSLYQFLIASGVLRDQLLWFQDNPCPPDLIGINHYVTSDRFLDENLGAYPLDSAGSNAHQRYADVDAIRVRTEPYDGWSILGAAWRRYGVPVALTEVHLGCTREEQLRWVSEAWTACLGAAAQGVPVRAMTVWALFGSYDWNSLLTRATGHYEAGAFDVRGNLPRPTALAAQISSLVTQSSSPTHPAAGSQGWWRRPERLQFLRPAPGLAVGPGLWLDPTQTTPLLILGAGTLARAFARACTERGLQYRLLKHTELDICDPQAVEAAVERHSPWGVINAAGYVRVDEAEVDAEQCFRVNSSAPWQLAAALARRGARLVVFSSDLVFDGRSTRPYVETDETCPLNVYGQSKVGVEGLVHKFTDVLCIRTAAFFGYGAGSDFLEKALSTLQRNQQFYAMSDVFVSPTYVPDLVHTCLDLLLDGSNGIWHLANRGVTSWADLANRAAMLTGVDRRGLVYRPQADFRLPALRPAYSALGSLHGHLMPTLEDALDRFTRLQRTINEDRDLRRSA